MTVTLQNGQQATVVISKEKANAVVVVDGVERVVAFIRDAKKVVIKNDMLLSPVDMQHVKLELSKFIKVVSITSS